MPPLLSRSPRVVKRRKKRGPSPLRSLSDNAFCILSSQDVSPGRRPGIGTTPRSEGAQDVSPGRRPGMGTRPVPFLPILKLRRGEGCQPRASPWAGGEPFPHGRCQCHGVSRMGYFFEGDGGLHNVFRPFGAYIFLETGPVPGAAPRASMLRPFGATAPGRTTSRPRRANPTAQIHRPIPTATAPKGHRMSAQGEDALGERRTPPMSHFHAMAYIPTPAVSALRGDRLTQPAVPPSMGQTHHRTPEWPPPRTQGVTHGCRRTHRGSLRSPLPTELGRG